MRKDTRVPRSETVSLACSPLWGPWDCGMYSGIHSPRERSLSTAQGKGESTTHTERRGPGAEFARIVVTGCEQSRTAANYTQIFEKQ